MTQLTTAQLSLGISSHNNRFLFSDHYLNVILKQDKRWKAAVNSAETLLPILTGLYNREKAQLPNYSESQLEDNWFKPIFKELGHTFEGQAKIPGLGTEIKYPDFVYFPDDTTRQQAVSQQKTHDYVQNALAAGEVKAWDVRLGKKKKGSAAFDDNNPSYQIDYYLRATDLDWGILSNGRLWRLVHKESSYKLDVFFEIDVAQAIEDQNKAAIAFFVLFFQQAAFVPDGTGQRFLDDALTASAQYALLLENDLRDNAYKALEHLIQGFIEPKANNLTADDLPTIYTNCLYLLYRIIFLFYGESRGLLPIENPDYQHYSITQFARDIASKLDQGKVAPPMTDEAWGRLKRLFTIIAGTQPDLNSYLGVPRYNGGLFNPDLHPFLERHFVGDRYLHAAIDAIARREVGDKKADLRRENVDYRTLGVRQLGSIYEGLLEYQPQRATEPLAAIKKKKGEEWIASSAVKGRMKVLDRRNAGDIYLVTDKGERKATGSYYTPDYIVKYIVEQTLGPLVDQVRERVKAQQDGEAFAKEILQLDVLDPAMGSGHFLVEATDYLARAIATDAYVDIEDTAATGDDDLVYWRRQVVEACIYGVDKNAMAVELAKLSLWLVTVARDRPLSFLDHHLRHGDSLVGARVEDLNALPERKKKGSKKQGVGSKAAQPMLLNETALVQDTFKAVGGMIQIETMLSDSIDDIYAKEKVLRGVRANLDRWRTIADLWTSSFFGNDMTPEEYGDLLRHLQGQESMMSAEQRDRFLNHPTLRDNDYFHWQLAFPEVFYNAHGQPLGDNAGFDAVVGNPPYVRQEKIAPYKKHYQEMYASFSGSADLFLYFYEQSVRLLQASGRLGYITSGTFAKTNSAKPFRKWFPTAAQLEVLIDFGENQPFDGAEMVRPSILILSKGTQSDNFQSMFMDGTTIWKPLDTAMGLHRFECDRNVLHEKEWTFQSVEKSDLARKIFAAGSPLSESIDGQIYYGIKTGLNEAFYIDTATRQALIAEHSSSAKVIKPMARGADLRPWYQQPEDSWLIFSQQGIEIENYPAIKKHLEKYREALEPKPTGWSKRWNGRKAGSYVWYELQDTVAYASSFDEPKIVWSDITKLPRFSWDDGGLYVNQKCYLIPNQHPSLLAILQSRVNWFAISQICTPLRLRAGLWQYQVLAQFVNRLPIPLMREETRTKLGAIAMEITNLVKQRYRLHQKMRNRIQSDLGKEGVSLNTKLTAWWTLAFGDFRAQIKKVFKRDIRLAERDEWEEYLAQQQAKHKALTTQIIALETELNAIVYRLFDLTDDEIQLIEASTKYQYGEV